MNHYMCITYTPLKLNPTFNQRVKMPCLSVKTDAVYWFYAYFGV